MRTRSAIAVFLSVATALPAWSAPVSVPSAGDGETLGVDPYVAVFQSEMSDIKAQLVLMQGALTAINILPTKASGIAGLAAAAAAYVPMTALMARTEAAQDRMLNHILGYRTSDVRFGVMPPVPRFEEKKDAALDPAKDPTLRRSELASDRVTDAVASAPTIGAPKKAAAPMPRLALKSMSSQFSYNATSGPVGAGFGGSMRAAPGFNTTTALEAAYYSPGPAPAPTGGGAASDPGTAISAGGGSSDTGVGAGSGSPTGSLGNTSGATDLKPAASPSADSLSHNKSDVAQKAFERMQQKQEQARQEMEQQRQQEQQKKQMMMQMMMQGLQAAMQMVQQAAKGAEDKKKDKDKQGQQAEQSGA